MINIRPIGTRFTENWTTYQNDGDGSFDGYFRHRTNEKHYSRVLEVISHDNGKEVCRIVEER